MELIKQLKVERAAFSSCWYFDLTKVQGKLLVGFPSHSIMQMKRGYLYPLLELEIVPSSIERLSCYRSFALCHWGRP